MKNSIGKTGLRLFAGMVALGLYLALGTQAHALPQYVIDCTECHTMPPLDSATPEKDPENSSIPGNHQKHATSDVNSCAKCHGDVVKNYATGHRNKTIEFRAELGYDAKRAFLNQTSVPPSPLGSCSTAACHSDGKGNFRSTPAWGNMTPANCDTCHASAPGTASHTKHISTYSYGCAKCHTDHSGDAKPFSHATSAGRAIDVHFNGTNSAGSFAGNQCSNTYCHSNGQGGAPNVAATWGATLNCASCHGTASSTGGAALSGAHASHVNNAAVIGNNFQCQECHAATVSGNFSIIDRAKHVDGTKDVSGANVGTVSGGSCSTSYCHSSGKGSFVPAAWTGAALGCNGCHGTTTATGAPDYANAGAGFPNANSHAKHATSAASCVNCHSRTTANGAAIIAGSQHLNGFINFTSGNGVSFGKEANKTCSNISCHSSNGLIQNVASAQWGATLDCQGCHVTLSSAHSAHTGAYGCLTCHDTTVTGNTALKAGGAHMNAALDVSGSKIASFDLATQSCSAASCHSGATVPKWNVAASGQCGTCHNVTSPLIATGAHAQHFTALNGPGFSQTVAGCQVCHSYSSESTHVDGVKNLNAGFAASGTCSTCHKQTTSWTDAATVTCESCHSTAGGALSVIGGKTAPDKTLAATKGHGAQGQACSACHDGSSAHIGVAGGTSRLAAGLAGGNNAECNFCHADQAKVTRTFGMKAHQSSGLGSKCADCHDPHGNANTVMVNTTINGTAVSYTGTSTFANGAQTGVCQVCHTSTKYFTKPGTTAPQTHVDSTTNCLDCHKHAPTDGALAFTANGACDACHGYPPAPRKLLAGQTLTFGVQGSWSSARFEDYSGGGGAHLILAHIPKEAKAADGWKYCLPCHSGGSASHARALPIKDHVENVSVAVDNQFRLKASMFVTYTSAKLVSGGQNQTGSCYNASCHFKKSRKWSVEK